MSPAITAFDVDSGTFLSTVTLRVQVLSPDRRVLVERLVTATSNPERGSRILAGFYGTPVLERSIASAFRSAMDETSALLRSALNAPERG